MAIVQVEFSRIVIDGETGNATVEYNDVTNLILAYILTGVASRRRTLAARGTGSGTDSIPAGSPFVRLNLASQGLQMIPGDDGGVRTPPGLVGIAEWVRPGR